jgi:hypothetical protein
MSGVCLHLAVVREAGQQLRLVGQASRRRCRLKTSALALRASQLRRKTLRRADLDTGMPSRAATAAGSASGRWSMGRRISLTRNMVLWLSPGAPALRPAVRSWRTWPARCHLGGIEQHRPRRAAGAPVLFAERFEFDGEVQRLRRSRPNTSMPWLASRQAQRSSSAAARRRTAPACRRWRSRRSAGVAAEARDHVVEGGMSRRRQARLVAKGEWACRTAPASGRPRRGRGGSATRRRACGAPWGCRPWRMNDVAGCSASSWHAGRGDQEALVPPRALRLPAVPRLRLCAVMRRTFRSFLRARSSGS